MACGGGADAETAAADDGGAAAASAATVSIDGSTFSPAALDVAAGTTVEWNNAEDVPHTVTFTTDGVEDSGELNEGDAFSATFAEAGTFDYTCAIHPDMKGSVTVK